MGTLSLFVVFLFVSVVGLLAAKFTMRTIKKSRVEKMLRSFDGCRLEEVVEACETAGIKFDSSSFRRLREIQPYFVGKTYGSLLKAGKVPSVSISTREGIPGITAWGIDDFDYRIRFLARELAEASNFFAKTFINGVAVRHPEYSENLREALSLTREELRKKKILEQREKNLCAGIKALGGTKKKKVNTFDIE
jgi:hypothetical protein